MKHLFRPFFISHTTNYVVNKKTLQNAYHIELKDQDVRWLVSADEEEAFEAWHVKTNQVLVRVAGPGYSFWKKPEEEEESRKTSQYNDERIIESYNVSRNAVLGDSQNMYTYYLLTFTEAQHGLQNDVFSPDASDGILDADVHIVESTFEFKGKDVTNIRVNIVWDIAIIERIQRKKEETGKKKNKLNSKLLAGMTRMNI